MPSIAASLAKPVVRGLLPRTHAVAALAVRLAQEGTEALEKRLGIEIHILDLNIRNELARRAVASGAISRVIRPLIEQLAPRNHIVAAAHDVNGDSGFPLSEREVEEDAATEVYWSLQRGRSVGRR